MPRPRPVTLTKGQTVLFADLTGADILYDRLGDARALMHITHALALLEEQADEHRGQVIKTIGVEMFCRFPDASAAATAAVAMQQRTEDYAASVAVGLGLKIGLCSGSLIEQHGDVFGDAVNIAARLVKLAHSGQIVTEVATASALRAPLRRRTRAFERLLIKGKTEALDVVELNWRRRAGAPLTTEQAVLLQRRPSASLTLFVDGRRIPINSGGSAFTMGRDADNDLPIASRKVSRQHARIEWRRNKFVLFDHSTNGTYVALEGEPEVMVKHESFLLRGRGQFRLGEAVKAKGAGSIGFECP